ncbi:thermonuclease family protein [Ulvibacter antarcticus]|uniref:Endonuclease YncB(Thermonuclease family) n=1 Tax=Ulvibacter antarcticus TaxID=442714 RepID=A0A3L9Z510_9FLAO|nr:thermonuclease family protein [Ulvibacter antarcticus]RMA66559.1 endonuclease YncB(thermonuclease family) [Ulvibacter antarcticus]
MINFKSSTLLSLILLFLIGWNSYSQVLSGKVIAITDGDTFKLMTIDSIIHRIRIASIDCPEKKQAFSKRAKQFTSDAVFGKNIIVEVASTDRYGRLIAKVHYNDSLVLNEELLRNGLAWHFVKYSKDTLLQELEDHARNEKIGLWQDPSSIPPWEWRSKKKKSKKLRNNP